MSLFSLLQLCLQTFSFFSFTVSSSSFSFSFFLLPASPFYLSCSSFFLLFILLILPLSPTLSFSCSFFLFLLLLLSSFPLPPIYSSSSPFPSISDIKLRALHTKASALAPLPRCLQKYFQGCLWPILLLPGDKAQGPGKTCFFREQCSLLWDWYHVCSRLCHCTVTSGRICDSLAFSEVLPGAVVSRDQVESQV